MKSLLLITDLDGTLLDDRQQIPERAMQAIRRFTDAGGRFTVATGRTEDTCRLATDLLPISVPVILYNGASIYDLKAHRVVTDRFLAASDFLPIVQEIAARFPDVCIEIFGYGPILLPNPAAPLDPYISRERQPYRMADWSALPAHWLKIMLRAPGPRLKEVEALLSAQKLPPCQRFFSADWYYELLPPMATKGSAAEQLAELLHIPRQNVIALGDHCNDVELLQWVGHAFVPANARPEAAAVAEKLPSTNNEGAIADAIAQFL